MGVRISNAPPHEHVSLEGVRDDVGLPGVCVPRIVAVDKEHVGILRHLVFGRRLERGKGDGARRVERARVLEQVLEVGSGGHLLSVP